MGHQGQLHHPSYWPITGSFALFFLGVGVINWIHQNTSGPYLFLLGSLIFIFMLFGWFRAVINENFHKDNLQTHQAFNWGMFWFIFSEFMFFSVFFMALFYIRMISIPQLGGDSADQMTHLLLWPDFNAMWPLFHTPDPSQFTGPHAVSDPWGIPALNTLVLIASDLTITWAYWSVLNKQKVQVILGLVATLLLSIAFLYLQVHEFGMAYTKLGLQLNSGIYGSIFFMLTGVHGTHVVAGLFMVLVLLFRALKGHFDPKHSFAVGAISWYWHFIDVLWLALFIFVYWL